MPYGSNPKINDMAVAVEALLVNTGVTIPPPPDPLGAGVPAVPTVQEQLADLRVAITGQQAPPPPTGWPMSNNRSAKRLDALEPVVALLQAQFATLNETVNTTFPALSLRLEQTEATINSLQAQQQADELADEALRAYEQQTRALVLAADAKAVAAQATADAAKTAAQAADAKAVAAQARADADAAAIALLQARATADEAAIASAQQAATAAQAKADTAAGAASSAQTAAASAQALATSANTAAASAQTNATAAQTAANTAITNAATAQTAATNAQAATTALAAKFREKRVATNAMALGATITQTITWDTPFADDKYSPIAELAGAGLLGMAATVTAWTASTVTVQIKNVLGLQLLAGAGTLIVTAKHD